MANPPNLLDHRVIKAESMENLSKLGNQTPYGKATAVKFVSLLYGHEPLPLITTQIFSFLKS